MDHLGRVRVPVFGVAWRVGLVRVPTLGSLLPRVAGVRVPRLGAGPVLGVVRVPTLGCAPARGFVRVPRAFVTEGAAAVFAPTIGTPAVLTFAPLCTAVTLVVTAF